MPDARVESVLLVPEKLKDIGAPIVDNSHR